MPLMPVYLPVCVAVAVLCRVMTYCLVLINLAVFVVKGIQLVALFIRALFGQPAAAPRSLGGELSQYLKQSLPVVAIECLERWSP
jgi:hypothetical protein